MYYNISLSSKRHSKRTSLDLCEWQEKRDILIPARTECRVQVNIPLLGQDGLVELLTSTLPGDLQVPAAIIDAQTNVSVMKILNGGVRDVWLKPRTRIGTVSTSNVVNDEVAFEVYNRKVNRV